jgi:hypothetical protein
MTKRILYKAADGATHEQAADMMLPATDRSISRIVDAWHNLKVGEPCKVEQAFLTPSKFVKLQQKSSKLGKDPQAMPKSNMQGLAAAEPSTSNLVLRALGWVVLALETTPSFDAGGQANQGRAQGS